MKKSDGKQSTFEFTDTDLVFSKGRSASWDGGAHLPQIPAEVTWGRSCSKGGQGWQGYCAHLLRHHPAKLSQAPAGLGSRMAALSWAGSGAPEAAE